MSYVDRIDKSLEEYRLPQYYKVRVGRNTFEFPHCSFTFITVICNNIPCIIYVMHSTNVSEMHYCKHNDKRYFTDWSWIMVNYKVFFNPDMHIEELRAMDYT